MAKLQGKAKGKKRPRLIPTKIKGLFVLALKRGEFTAYQVACEEAKAIEDDAARKTQLGWLTLHHHARDAEGAPFDDLASPESMTEFDDAELAEYEAAIMEVLAPNPKPLPEAPKGS